MIPVEFLQLLLPETLLASVAFIILLFGAYFNSERTMGNINLLTVCLLILLVLVYASMFSTPPTTFYGMYYSDSFAIFAKILIILSALASLLLSSKWVNQHPVSSKEYPVLLIFATLGLVLLVSAENFLSFYVALELASLSMYVMASYERDNKDASEAGLKYFVLGSLASGMLLFGISLIYGFSGTIRFDYLTEFLSNDYAYGADIGIVTGLVLVLVAVCFKISAVPFHMWTPDVYEGAPTPVVAFFATAPKVAIICFAIRLLSHTFQDIIHHWEQVVLFVSAASMLIGALAGLVQHNIKRLIAYSSIGHIGYILMGVAASTPASAENILVYLSIYIAMSLGLFACLILLQRENKAILAIQDLSGLSKSHPKIALSIAILMFSMAGIPPFAGFFAKAFLFASVLEAGLTSLAVFAVLTSVIACFYYIRIVKVMYFDEQHASPDLIDTKQTANYVLLVSLLINVFIFYPSIIMEPSKAAVEVLFP